MSKPVIGGILALVAVAAVCAARAAWLGFETPDHHRAYEVIAAMIVGILAIAGGVHTFFHTQPGVKIEELARSAIAFNAVVFLVIGACGVIVATEQWPIALLWAGAFLLGGGFIGLLFGVPLQAKAQAKSDDKDAPKTPQERSRTLLGEAADTFSKFLTGAAAVKYNDIYAEFKKIAHYLATCLQCCKDSDGGYNSSFAAGLILYFAAVGFVSGILLPQYYMHDLLDAQLAARQPQKDAPPRMD